MTNSLSKQTRRLSLAAGLTLIAAGTMSSTAQAATYTLDFDQGANGGEVLYNADGTLVTTQWSSMGLVNITGTNGRTNKSALFNTYDSAYNTQQEDNLRAGWLRDDDLRSGSNWGTEAQGNLLIIQEQDGGNTNFYNNNGYYREDDEAGGGTVNFEFDNSVLFKSFSLMDVDDDGNSAAINVRAIGENGGFDIDVKALIQGHYNTHGNSKGSSFTQEGVTITQMGTKRGNNSLYQFDLDANYFANMRVEHIEFQYPGSGAIAGLEWNIGGLLMVGFVARKLRRKGKLSAISERA